VTAYRVTRDVSRDEPHNYLGRDVVKGEVFYRAAHPAYGCIDTDNGLALTEKPDGDYPFFEFPLNAVEDFS
jgi:hypothetical protein